MWDLPFEFEPAAYRSAHPELEQLEDEELLAHYNARGKQLGLTCNRIAHRQAFAALVPPEASALELGPFAAPLLAGENVRYADVLDTHQLRMRAPQEGMDPARVPHIHHVLREGTLDSIDERFDAILSSHVLEHQPDLVAHLQQVERRLQGSGRYLVLVPDKRYCFDRNMAVSTIAEVLQAHQERRKAHTLRSVIEHRAFRSHNDPVQHWEAGQPPVEDGRDVSSEVVTAAVREHAQAGGGYIDVHAWYFTPDSFRQVMRLLHELELTRLQVERLYRTRRHSVEFWAVLATDPGPPGPFDPAAQVPEDLVPPSAPVLPRMSGGLLGRTLRTLVNRN